MGYNRVLTIQDVSCLGQCSGTVAMPIISACGQECCIIPSAVLSTHTGGFTGYTFADLTDEIPKIREHWEKESLKFDCIYTGYLGNTRQAGYVCDIVDSCLKEGGLLAVDPAMADNGNLYYGFDDAYVEAMRGLCSKADILLPNITEASFLTGLPFKKEINEKYILQLLEGLTGLGAKDVILTGVSYREGYTGVIVYRGGNMSYYEHEYITIPSHPNGWHGTGDIYASAFVGSFLHGQSYENAAKIAADFVVASIHATSNDPDHWYGVKFETQIRTLVKAIS